MNHNDASIMRPNFNDQTPMRAPSRQEKGTMKVDPHQVTEDLCKSVFIHRAVIAVDMSPAGRQTYLRSTKWHDEELVAQAGRDLATIKSAADRRAAEYITKQERQRGLQAFEDKAKELVALVDSMRKTDAEAEETDLDESMNDLVSSGATAASRATRGGLDRKRKQEEEDLIKQSAEINKMAKMMKERRRQS